MARLELRPVTLREAQAFVNQYHRHNVAAQGHKFSIGLDYDGQLVGVATVGRPIARNNDDGKTAEITRVCVNEGYTNANSMLYGACVRACKAMGYQKVITYTLVTESGSSLKATGFQKDGIVEGRKSGWDTPSRRRTLPDRYPYEKKIRWMHS